MEGRVGLRKRKRQRGVGGSGRSGPQNVIPPVMRMRRGFKHFVGFLDEPLRLNPPEGAAFVRSFVPSVRSMGRKGARWSKHERRSHSAVYRRLQIRLMRCSARSAERDRESGLGENRGGDGKLHSARAEEPK